MSYLPTWNTLAADNPGVDVSSSPQYVNSATIALSQWDLSVNFRLQRPTVDDAGTSTGVASEAVVQVVMSPTHAKVLAHLLEQAVQEWEGRFGVLPTVDRLIPRPAQAETEGDDAS
jgi:hypothetical protein